MAYVPFIVFAAAHLKWPTQEELLKYRVKYFARPDKMKAVCTNNLDTKLFSFSIKFRQTWIEYPTLWVHGGVRCQVVIFSGRS